MPDLKVTSLMEKSGSSAMDELGEEVQKLAKLLAEKSSTCTPLLGTQTDRGYAEVARLQDMT